MGTTFLNNDNIMDSNEFKREDGRLNVPLGRAENGELLVRDLLIFPNILVSGCSKTGKTSFIRTIISEALTEYKPYAARFIIYSDDKLYYESFGGFPVSIWDKNLFASFSDPLNYEWKQRKEIFSGSSAEHSDGVKIARELDEKKIHELFIVLDDFSSFKLSRDSERAIRSILREGGKLGIHLIIIASKVYSNRFLSTLSMDNFCRICFRVNSQLESKRVVGSGLAMNLETPGEFVYKFKNENYKCYGVCSDSKNIRAAINNLKTPELNYELIRIGIATAFADLLINILKGDVDHYLVEAGFFATEKQMISASLLQREFKINQSKALKMMDNLEILGVISAEDGINPRKVLMNPTAWGIIADCLSKRYHL